MSVSGWTAYDEFGRKTDQYNAGGKIYSIVNNDSYAYVSRSDYNYFVELAYQKYGNNTETVYAYTDKLRRLNSISAKNSSNQILMNPVYSYDYIYDTPQNLDR